MNIVTPPSSPRYRGGRDARDAGDAGDAGDAEIYSDPFYLKDLFLNRISKVVSNDEFTQMLYGYLDCHNTSFKKLEKLIYRDLFHYVEHNQNVSLKSNTTWLKLKTDIEIYNQYKRRDSPDINIFLLENNVNVTAFEYLQYINKKKNIFGSYHHFLVFYFYHLHFERLL